MRRASSRWRRPSWAVNTRTLESHAQYDEALYKALEVAGAPTGAGVLIAKVGGTSLQAQVLSAELRGAEEDDGEFGLRIGDEGERPPRSSGRRLVTGGPNAPPDQPGTLGCIAPELLADEDADHRSDLWSVGSIMYVMLLCREIDTGDGDGDEPLVVLSPATYLPSIPKAVSDVVMRALAGVEQRYPTAMAMAQAIHAAVAGAPPRRPRVSLWAGAGGVALGAVFGVVAAWASLGAAPAASSAPLAESEVVAVQGVTTETTTDPRQSAGDPSARGPSPPAKAMDALRATEMHELSDSGGPAIPTDLQMGPAPRRYTYRSQARPRRCENARPPRIRAVVRIITGRRATSSP